MYFRVGQVCSTDTGLQAYLKKKKNSWIKCLAMPNGCRLHSDGLVAQQEYWKGNKEQVSFHNRWKTPGMSHSWFTNFAVYSSSSQEGQPLVQILEVTLLFSNLISQPA